MVGGESVEGAAETRTLALSARSVAPSHIDPVYPVSISLGFTEWLRRDDREVGATA
jgi:hypothetical protein